MANWPLTSIGFLSTFDNSAAASKAENFFIQEQQSKTISMGRVMDSYFLALTAIVTGTNSRMEVKGFGRIRYAYSFASEKTY
ncbi:uncharacterized protein [Malus domestica]|uniref:uncharacterized protein isoform X2 n=1 Tax=Malus domestica TaxID=3750 RepID=UPI003975F688